MSGARSAGLGAPTPRGSGPPRSRHTRVATVALVSLLMSSCAAETSGGPSTPPWTEGCGRKVGDTLCELTLMGYGHEVEAPYALERSLRGLVQSAPRPHALVLLGGSWCPSCRKATQFLVAHHGEIAPHYTVVNVLVEGAKPTEPARKSHLDEWRKTHKTPFAVLADGYESPMAARDALGFREVALVVDRATGEVLARESTLALLWPALTKTR